MITRLYANNFRCLVAFEAKFDSLGVLCGPNGAGKSSIFDALRIVRNLATGDGVLGGDRDQDVPHLEFTNWQKGTIQEFELGVTAEEHAFVYTIHIEQKADFEKPRIISELTDPRALAQVDTFGDLNLSFEGCAVNQKTGNPHCKPGDIAGRTTYFAIADYLTGRGKNPIVMEAGKATCPSGPGLGLEMDWDVVESLALKN